MIFERRQTPRTAVQEKPFCKIIRLAPKTTNGQQNIYMAYSPETKKAALGKDMVDAWLRFNGVAI